MITVSRRRLVRRTRVQMQVLAVLTAATVAYSAVAYLDVAKLVGFGHYDLRVHLADGGGIYEGSLVTLSGVEVGEVTSIEAGRKGVVATVRLEDEAKVPRSARVEVRSISAAGEQYLDISTPGVDPAATDLYAPGDTIPVGSTAQPVSTNGLLRRVDGLVTSLPVDDLNTTIDELGAGLHSGGRDLQTLLDAILPLQGQFTANLEPTEQLIARSEPVLGTQRRTEDRIRAATAQLDRFSAELASSDEALRGALDDVPTLAAEVTALVDELGPTLPTLLTSLVQVGEVTSVYDASLRHILTVLPGVANGFQTALNVSPVPGSVSLFARSVVNDPPPCVTGFVQKRRQPQQLEPITPPTKVYCQVDDSSDQAVRGARNYPCPDGVRRGPTAAACGLQFDDPATVEKVQDEALATQVASAERYLDSEPGAGTPRDGALGELGLPPDSPLVLLGSARADGSDDDWQSLLLAPLGLS
jgi:phospholipid/cholesterol/gamma-HCH transport system substrate-binding protein